MNVWHSFQGSAGGALELNPGDPVVTHRFDVAPVGVDLRLFRPEQLKDAQQHRVVALLRKFHRSLPDGEKHLAVMLHDLTGCEERKPRGADLGARVHRYARQPLLALAKLGLDATDQSLSSIEDRQLETQRRPGDSNAGLGAGLSAHSDFNTPDEARGVRDVERLGQDASLLPRRGDIQSL